MSNKSKGNKNSKQGSTGTRGKQASPKDKVSKSRNVADVNSPQHYINRVMESTNDFEWYNKNPKLTENVGNISFYNQLGAYFNTEVSDTNNRYSTQVPGLMVFNQVTCPGYSNAANDPASLAAIQLYDYVRSALNKPNPDYEAQDLFMVMYAISDIYSQYVNILRMFGICHTWSGDNLYTPRTYLRGLYGLSAAEITNLYTNEANLRAQFNYLITKASSYLYYPEGYSITDRQAWLFGSLFTDHNSRKAQVYAYRKHNYWLFSETLSENGTALEYKELVGNVSTVAGYLQVFDQCIEALRSSDLVRIVLSDMRQAFADKNTLAMAYLDDRYTMDYTYDPVALMQIENMDILSQWNEFTVKDITQDVDHNYIKYAPRVTDQLMNQNTSALENGEKIINLHKDDVTKADVFEATRGKIVVYQGLNANHYLFAASDFCVRCYIYFDSANQYFTEFAQYNYLAADSFNDVFLNEVLKNWIAFDWAPHFNLYVTDESGNDHAWTAYEYDHYTSIGVSSEDGSVLRRINTVALLSLWSIPEHGTFKP